MDAQITFPKLGNLTHAQASATGAGLLTAVLGIFDHLHVPLLSPSNLPAPNSRNEWALVFGGAGSVGQFAVQFLKLSGFKVIVTCSPKSNAVRLFSLSTTITPDPLPSHLTTLS